MICRFFDDIIIRKEDVEDEFQFVPGDAVDIHLVCHSPVTVFIVKDGEKPTKKGE